MADDNDENEVASDLPTNETGNSTEDTAAKAEEGGG
jgi:hypothetical protein